MAFFAVMNGAWQHFQYLPIKTNKRVTYTNGVDVGVSCWEQEKQAAAILIEKPKKGFSLEYGAAWGNRNLTVSNSLRS